MLQTLKFSWPAVVIAGAIILLAVVLFEQPQPALGSVTIGSAYQATTTQQASFAPVSTLSIGSGDLGSIVITGAAAGVITLYDATTSNVNARTGQTATSSLRVLASIPAAAAAGTYTFDEVYGTGILVSIIGTVPTTTITFR